MRYLVLLLLLAPATALFAACSSEGTPADPTVFPPGYEGGAGDDGRTGTDCRDISAAGADPNPDALPVCGRPVAGDTSCGVSGRLCTGVCGVETPSCVPGNSCCVKSCSGFAGKTVNTCTPAEAIDGPNSGTAGVCDLGPAFELANPSAEYCTTHHCCGAVLRNPAQVCPADAYCGVTKTSPAVTCCMSKGQFPAGKRDGSTPVCGVGGCKCGDQVALATPKPCSPPDAPCGDKCITAARDLNAFVCCSAPGKPGKACPIGSRCTPDGKCIPENGDGCWLLREADIGAACDFTKPDQCKRGTLCLPFAFKCCTPDKKCTTDCNANAPAIGQCSGPGETCMASDSRCVIPPGAKCLVSSDCGPGRTCTTQGTSNVCSGGGRPETYLASAYPPDGDGQQSGSETDVDCGNPSGPTCGPGKQCITGVQCTSTVCNAGLCQ